MKIDFSEQIKDLKGKVLTVKDGDADSPMTLAHAAVEGLLSAYADEGPLDGTEKFRRYKLAVKVDNAKEVELETEEVAKIKQMIAKRWAPLVVGRCYELIENGRKET